MSRFFQLFLAVLSSLLLHSSPSSAQGALHPLEPLRTEEYWTVRDVLVASGHLDADTHFVSVLLHEPAKALILAWNPLTASYVSMMLDFRN